jgi:hypothetical protein
MKTAVDFLHSEYNRILGSVLVTPQQIIEMSDALENAKEIEKGQIGDAYERGFNQGYRDPEFLNTNDSDDE